MANAQFAGAPAPAPAVARPTRRPPHFLGARSRSHRAAADALRSVCAEIGKAFSEHYYNTFDSNRANLQTLYTDQSMLTFENEQFMGMQAIMTKLTVC